jgi:WD40 repeat protein
MEIEILPNVDATDSQKPALAGRTGSVRADNLTCSVPAGTLTGAPDPEGDGPVGAPEIPTVTGYELLEVIGRGGMGVVYRARQEGLNREVALKMILAGVHAGPVERLRFLTEAEVVAGLLHPHVVPVYEFGTRGGQPFFSMEHLGGGSLADRIRDRPMPPRAAATLVAALAGAVHAAHRRGVVHRDLKPANVLYSTDGTPKVVDFGLARHASSELTATHAVMGTPSYMAPEQAEGRSRDVGPATDVYALGAVLYECLTGRAPFKGETAALTLEMVRTRNPVPPRSLVPGVPRDLETVCLKCLRKEPGQRYAGADQLAADLHRFLAGEPIAARPVGAAERLVRWARRNPTQAGLVVAVALLFTVAPLALGTALLWREAEEARQRSSDALGRVGRAQEETAAALAGEQQARSGERQAREREAAERERSDRVSYLRLVGLAHRAWQANEVTEAKQYLAECPPGRRDWVWHYVNRLSTAELFTVPDVWFLIPPVVSADGRYVAFAGREPGHAIHVWDLRTRTQVLRYPEGPATQGAANTFRAVAFSPDGTRVAWVREVRRGTGEVTVREPATGKELYRFEVPLDFTLGDLTFSPDGARLATVTPKQLTVWEVASGRQVFAVESKAAGGIAFTGGGFSRDGNRVAAWGQRRDADRGQLVVGRTWDLKAGTDDVEVVLFGPEREWEGWKEPAKTKAYLSALHNGGAIPFGFSPDGERVLSPEGASSGRVRVCRVTDRTPLVLTHGARRLPIAAADWDHGWVATAGDDRTAKVWDGATGALLRTFHGHAQWVQWAAFRPGTTELLTLGEDGVLRVWDAAADPDATRFRVPDLGSGVHIGMSGVSGVWAASADLARVAVVDAVGDADHDVTVWDTAAGRPVGPPLRIRSGRLSVAFAADARTLLVAGVEAEREAIRRIDPTTGKPTGPDMPLDKLPGSGAVVLHRDGARALAWAFRPLPAAGRPERGVELGVLDPTTGRLLRDLPVIGVQALPRFSADGHAVVFRSNEGGWRTFDPGTGAELWAGAPLPDGLNWRSGGADLLAVGPGGRAAVVRDTRGAYDALVDPDSGTVLVRLELSRHAHGPVEFSPDGRFLARWVDPGWLSALTTGDPQGAPVRTGAGIRLWDTKSGSLVLTFPITGDVQLLQFSADGRKLLTATRTRDTVTRKRVAHVQVFDATPRE